MPGLPKIDISKYHLEYEFIGNRTVSVVHQIREPEPRPGPDNSIPVAREQQHRLQQQQQQQ